MKVGLRCRVGRHAWGPWKTRSHEVRLVAYRAGGEWYDLGNEYKRCWLRWRECARDGCRAMEKDGDEWNADDDSGE